MQNCGPTGVLLKEVCPRHQINNFIHHIRCSTMLFDTLSGFVRIDLMKYYGMELKNVLRTFSTSNCEKNKNAQPRPQN